MISGEIGESGEIEILIIYVVILLWIYYKSVFDVLQRRFDSYKTKVISENL